MVGKHFLLIGLAAGALGASACGGGPATPGAPALVFEGPAAQTMSSASGSLQIAVWWSPSQPTVGYDATQLAITDAGGAPVPGLDLTVIPWMPAHGHGTSVQPTVTETAPGVYVATPLDFFMAGTWELRSSIAGGASDSGAGDTAAVADTFVPMVNVP
ncbi:MAG TPA: FixH family protein [Polyangia bacterium]|nr:FixH family protein [Polyangia bacterium]